MKSKAQIKLQEVEGYSYLSMCSEQMSRCLSITHATDHRTSHLLMKLKQREQ